MSRDTSTHHYDYISACYPVATLPMRFSLEIRQHPVQSRVSTSNERDRRPIDPPPIVQIRLDSSMNQEMQDFLQNPYFFMCANLVHPTRNTEAFTPEQNVLSGQVVSSMYKLKDIDNNDGGFFVFGDLSVKVEGRYRLKFTLFEIVTTGAVNLLSCFSDCFTVYSSKTFPGVLESTFLSRSFSDQGVRIRIRKEHRVQIAAPRKRKLSLQNAGTEHESRESHQQQLHHQHQRQQMLLSRGVVHDGTTEYAYANAPHRACVNYSQARPYVHTTPPSPSFPPLPSLVPPSSTLVPPSENTWLPTLEGDKCYERRGSVNSLMTATSSGTERHSPISRQGRLTPTTPYSPPPQPYDPISRQQLVYYPSSEKNMPISLHASPPNAEAPRRMSLDPLPRPSSLLPTPQAATPRRASCYHYSDQYVRLPPIRNLRRQGNEPGEVDAAVAMMQLASPQRVDEAISSPPSFQPPFSKALESKHVQTVTQRKSLHW